MQPTPRRTTDPNTSLGNYSSFGSFNNAFKEAHATGGSGHTFSWNGNIYSTNRADGKDLCTNPDDRYYAHHFNGFGHGVNAWYKDTFPRFSSAVKIGDYMGHAETTWKTGGWTADRDRQRVNFHQAEIKKARTKKSSARTKKSSGGCVIF